MPNNKLSVSLIFVATWFFCFPPTAGAQNAGANKALTCVGCHGPEGNSSNGQYPILAGQQAAYLANQLRAFKNGARKNPTMNGLASGLSDEDINNLAAYFSDQKIKSAGGDPKLAKLGATKFSMCMGCHGPKAEGNGHFPRLAGQQPDYIFRQLKDFKEGVRKSGPMQAMTANLSEEDMKALAAYVGSL